MSVMIRSTFIIFLATLTFLVSANPAAAQRRGLNIPGPLFKSPPHYSRTKTPNRPGPRLGKGIHIHVGAFPAFNAPGFNDPYRHFPYYGAPELFQSYQTPGYVLGSPIYSNATSYGASSNAPFAFDSTSIHSATVTPRVSSNWTPSGTYDHLERFREKPLRTVRVIPSSPLSDNLVSTRYDAAEFQARAEVQFRQGKYHEAIRNVNHAMFEDPENGKLFLFASQLSLATKDYGIAAEQIGRATALLHRNEWDYVIRNRSELYSVTGYQDDLNELNAYVAKNPESVSALLVRGFHQGCLGLIDQARLDLSRALNLDPKNSLAIHLLASLQSEIVYPAIQPTLPGETAPGPILKVPTQVPETPLMNPPDTSELPEPETVDAKEVDEEKKDPPSVLEFKTDPDKNDK